MPRWSCRDRRYKTQLKSEPQGALQWTRNSRCKWNSEFDPDPRTDIDCVVKFCDNGTTLPFDNNLNYESVVLEADSSPYPRDPNLFAEPSLIELDSMLNYSCLEGFKLPADVDFKRKAPGSVTVLCNATGIMEYPDPWPPCLESITCTGMENFVL